MGPFIWVNSLWKVVQGCNFLVLLELNQLNKLICLATSLLFFFVFAIFVCLQKFHLRQMNCLLLKAVFYHTHTSTISACNFSTTCIEVCEKTLLDLQFSVLKFLPNYSQKHFSFSFEISFVKKLIVCFRFVSKLKVVLKMSLSGAHTNTLLM